MNETMYHGEMDDDLAALLVGAAPTPTYAEILAEIAAAPDPRDGVRACIRRYRLPVRLLTEAERAEEWARLPGGCDLPVAVIDFPPRRLVLHACILERLDSDGGDAADWPVPPFIWQPPADADTD